jgi:diguanylate cyclase (GGDEF)-like protein
MTAALSFQGAEDARHVAFCLAAAAAILWRARTVQGDRKMWMLLGLAALCDAVALGLWTYVFDSTEASPADALFAMFYILTCFAFSRLLRDRVGNALRTFSFDAVGITIYLTAIGTAVFARPTMERAGVGELQAAGYVGYVAFDVALASVIFAVSSFTGRRKGGQDLMIGAALLVTCTGDSLFVLSQAGWIGSTEWLSDLLWEGGLVVLALAAWTTRPPRAGTLRVGGWWESGPTLSWIAAGGGVLVAARIWDLPTIVGVLGALTLVLAAIRARRVVGEVRDLVIVRAESLKDEVTGLANQRALFGELELLMRAGGSDGQRHALLIGHLEGFSELTDTLGHEAAQELLRLVADRLAGIAPGTLARLDRDEFATIVEDVEPERVAAALDAALTSAPLVMDGIAISVRPVFGYASFPGDAQTVSELARRADVARRDARARGLDFAAYEPLRDHHSRDRLELAADLRAALRAHPASPDGLWLALQPQIGLESGTVLGAEALIRWQHPARGPIAPGELLPVAARAGLMSELTDWVLDRALAELAVLRAGGHPQLRISVNVSAITLVDMRLAARIGSALERHGVPPHALTIEVTEDAVMADHRRALEVLGQIAGVGAEISIDDFGTGHSSLGQLRHVPADELKIDRRFVSGMTADPLDEEIVRLVVALGRRMGMRVVAEGIETVAQELMLRRLGCDLVQGFGVGRPMGAHDLARWLRERPAAGVLDGADDERDRSLVAALHG